VYEVTIKKACAGFWNCLTPDAILGSLVTLLNLLITIIGIVLTAYITNKINKRQMKQNLKINFNDFYGEYKSKTDYLEDIVRRLDKLSKLDNYKDIQELRYQKECIVMALKLTMDSKGKMPAEAQDFFHEILNCVFGTIGRLEKALKPDEKGQVNTMEYKNYFQESMDKIKVNINKINNLFD
jgi:hypothetical protein